MPATRDCIALTLFAVLLMGSDCFARGAGEFGLLRPGKDQNLNWQPYHEVAADALERKKPVLIYFYDGQKSRENAQAMISAQMRLFPEAAVKGAAAGLICTQVDLTNPGEVERSMQRDEMKQQREARRNKRGRGGKKGGGGEGEGGAEDNDEGKGKGKADGEGESDGEGEPEEGKKEDGKEEGESGEGESPLILETSQWPAQVAIYFLDYRGRVIQKMSKISSNERSFVASIKKAIATNEKRIAADEKAAEKERKAAEKKAAAEEKKAAAEAKKREREAAEE